MTEKIPYRVEQLIKLLSGNFIRQKLPLTPAKRVNLSSQLITCINFKTCNIHFEFKVTKVSTVKKDTPK